MKVICGEKDGMIQKSGWGSVSKWKCPKCGKIVMVILDD
jgi:hypothetical protein